MAGFYKIASEKNNEQNILLNLAFAVIEEIIHSTIKEGIVNMDDTGKMPKVRGDLSIQELGEEVMIYDPLNEKVHILNNTAHCIWKLCDGNFTLQEIKEEISKKFPNTSEQDILHDIASAIDNFEKNKLLM